MAVTNFNQQYPRYPPPQPPILPFSYRPPPPYFFYNQDPPANQPYHNCPQHSPPVSPPRPCHRHYGSHFTFKNPNENRGFNNSRFPVNNYFPARKLERKSQIRPLIHNLRPPACRFDEPNNKSKENSAHRGRRDENICPDKRTARFSKVSLGKTEFMSWSPKGDDTKRIIPRVSRWDDPNRRSTKGHSSKESHNFLYARHCEPNSFSQKQSPYLRESRKFGSRDCNAYSSRRTSHETSIYSRENKHYPSSYREGRGFIESPYVPLTCYRFREERSAVAHVDHVVSLRSAIVPAEPVVNHLHPSDQSMDYTNTNAMKIAEGSVDSSAFDSSVLIRTCPGDPVIPGCVDDSVNHFEGNDTHCGNGYPHESNSRSLPVNPIGSLTGAIPEIHEVSNDLILGKGNNEITMPHTCTLKLLKRKYEAALKLLKSQCEATHTTESTVNCTSAQNDTSYGFNNHPTETGSSEGIFDKCDVDISFESRDFWREPAKTHSSPSQEEGEITDSSLDREGSIIHSHTVSSPFMSSVNGEAECNGTVEIQSSCCDERLLVESKNVKNVSEFVPFECNGDGSLLKSQGCHVSHVFLGAEKYDYETNYSNFDKKPVILDIGACNKSVSSCANAEMPDKNSVSEESPNNLCSENGNKIFNMAESEEKIPISASNAPSSYNRMHTAFHEDNFFLMQRKCYKCHIGIVHATVNMLCSDCISLSLLDTSPEGSAAPIPYGVRAVSTGEENALTSGWRMSSILSENASLHTSFDNLNHEAKDALVTELGRSEGVQLLHLQSQDNSDNDGLHGPPPNDISHDFCYLNPIELDKEKENGQEYDVGEILSSKLEDKNRHADDVTIIPATPCSPGGTVTSVSSFKCGFSEDADSMIHHLDSCTRNIAIRGINRLESLDLQSHVHGVETKDNVIGKEDMAVLGNSGMDIDGKREQHVFRGMLAEGKTHSEFETLDFLHKSTLAGGSHEFLVSANDHSCDQVEEFTDVHDSREPVLLLPHKLLDDSMEPVTLLPHKLLDNISRKKSVPNNKFCSSSLTSSQLVFSIPINPLQNSEIVVGHENASEHAEDQDGAKVVKGILSPPSGNSSGKTNEMSYSYSRGSKDHPLTFPNPKSTIPQKSTQKRHTWHRANKSLVLLDQKNKHLLADSQKQSPKKTRKMQNTYVRKGNSLVRKPSSVVIPGSYSGGHLSMPKICEMEKQKESNEMDRPSNCLTAVETPQPYEPLVVQRPSSVSTYNSLFFLHNPSDTFSATAVSTPELVETEHERTSEAELARLPAAENNDSLENRIDNQDTMDNQCIVTKGKKISYVKRRSNQLVAALSPLRVATRKEDKKQILFSDGYYKRSKHQLVRTLMENQTKQDDASQNDCSNPDSQITPLFFHSSSFNRRLSNKVKKRKKLGGLQSSKRKSQSLLVNMLPRLFPWKRATYRRFMHYSASLRPLSVFRNLYSSRKTNTIYTRSTRGLSLRKAKVMGVNGSNLKWSKSIDKKSKSDNQEATRALVEVQKRKRRRKDAFPAACKYIKLCNGNKLIRDSRKRSQILASEKVRWSLHTARNRLAKKRKYCQFYTRFGKCNKDKGECPYIHDPSKVAVCTKFLHGLCSKPSCKLTHEIIPERMQDCSYFLQEMCVNEDCPYRHVNVSRMAPVCDDFLKGYCADGDECRKKHRYVCLEFEITGSCSQGMNCKLLHPKRQSEGKKRKQWSWIDEDDDGGRYFSGRVKITECATTVIPKHSENEDDIFFKDGKFVDFIALDDGDGDEDPDGLQCD